MQEKAKCRICDKEFNPCKGITGIPPDQQPFNWRKICCSAACGSQYINSILDSRGLTSNRVPAETAVFESQVPQKSLLSHWSLPQNQGGRRPEGLLIRRLPSRRSLRSQRQKAQNNEKGAKSVN